MQATTLSMPVRVGVVRRARRGFTLIEVMIVIAIILALSALVGVALFRQRDRATQSMAQIDMNTIKSGLKQFRLTFDRWPTDEEGVAVLWDKDTLSPDADQSKWMKFLEDPMPSDRWGNPWGYRQKSEQGDEAEYDLWSTGPDGQEGTDDDITSWKKESDSSEGGAAGGGSGGTGG